MDIALYANALGLDLIFGNEANGENMILTKLLKQLFASRVEASVEQLLAAIRAGIEANDLVTAENAIVAALMAEPDHAEALFYRGFLEFRRGQHVDAIAAFRRSAERGYVNADCSYLMAQCHHALGDIKMAQHCCSDALKHDGDHVATHMLLARIALPGPEYTEVLSAIHRFLKPATYLEIGVAQGRSIALANARTVVIGVDPAPQIQIPLGNRVRIFAMTSDDFFEKHDVVREFGGQHLDLAFIDGMHLFDFALRDFAQVERHCNPDATVLLHDCFPLDRRTAERERVTSFSSGDVWRLILALKKYRPDLDIHTIATRPTGLALIRNLDPDSRVLTENMDRIVSEFSAIDYSVLDQNKRDMLNWFPNDFAKIEGLLKPNIRAG